MLRELAIVGVMGGVQPQKYWPCKKSGRKAIRKLVRYGALIQHEMLDEHDRVIPLYTLGPLAARSLEIRNYDPAYYKQLDRQEILRRLAFVQLYLRFYQKLQDARIKKAKPPFVGAIFLRLQDREIGFRVGVLRGNLNDLQSAMRWETERHRTLIIAEKLMHCQHLLEGINIEVTRFTTDYDLFRTPLSEMFYFWDRQTNRWEREIIDIFDLQTG